jgi:uncharacterized protein YbjT (DUF2867 family)
MFAIMGITGQVGGGIARALLQAGLPVRAIVRDEARGEAWHARGCEVAVATNTDTAALARAFAGTEGVFLMNPPDYDPEPGFPAVRASNAALRDSLRDARPGRVVFLSTVGAQVAEPNLLNNSALTERMLRGLTLPVVLLRAAWFMENAAWDVEAARRGVLPSFLQPLGHPIPMVAVADIADSAAGLLRETWQGSRVVELEGPQRYSAQDIADGFARALGHPVRAEAVPRETWEALFRAHGMRHPQPRMRMLDGFNEGWIDFEGAARKGRTPLDSVLRQLVERSGTGR